MKLMTKIDRLWDKNLPIVIIELLDGAPCWFNVYEEEDQWCYDFSVDYTDLFDDQIIGLLDNLANDYGSCIVDGKVCGPGYGVNDYGLEERIFIPLSISLIDDIEEEPLPILAAYERFRMHGFRTAPVLFKGPFSKCQVIQHLRRPSKMAPASTIKTPFKKRCGVVFTPQEPQYVENNWLEGWQPSMEYAELMGIDHGLPTHSSDNEETRA
jgi:hypothetical protein